jgi:hypothetical protein
MVLRQKFAHLCRELGRDLDRFGIPVGLGQCREAGEVCEDEGIRSLV